MEKRKRPSVWKFNDDDWKIHISSESLKEKIQEKFNLKKTDTIYYENGTFQEETAWDLVIPNKIINKVKKYIKDNS